MIRAVRFQTVLASTLGSPMRPVNPDDGRKFCTRRLNSGLNPVYQVGPAPSIPLAAQSSPNLLSRSLFTVVPLVRGELRRKKCTSTKIFSYIFSSWSL